MVDFVTNTLSLMDRADPDTDGDLDCMADDDDKLIDGEGNKKKFQNENVYNKFLTYDVSTESQEHLNRIKTSLAKCVEMNQETLYESFIDLERFIDLYGLAFTKEDHIDFVKLQYELIVSRGSMDLYHIALVAKCFSSLMMKRFLITSEDLTLDWRPLYETYESLLFSKTETLGLRFVPETLEANLSQAIKLARPLFSLESTQEMLDEWRPMLCPFSQSIQKTITYMNLFLPTTLPPEHHDKGFRLWFDEVMQLWLSGKVRTAHESKLTLLLSRLSSDCMGFIDWGPYIPRIFNHFKTSLNLNGGYARPQGRRANESVDVGPCIQWLIYMISTNNSCLDHMSKLLKAIESFYHPSNTDQRWHTKLQQFLYKLPACYVKRLYRERHKKNIWSKRIPEFHRLTDEQTTKFVDSLMPLVLTSMFNQAGISSAALAFRDLSVLRPERVIPPLLDRLYGSYETLTEPHRLLASINCMASVVPAMVRPCKYFPEGPTHVIPLLLNSLPGIDSNDMRKCIAVFRFVATLAAHVRMKDYSYLVDEKPNLTYEQQQLCLSTGQFEDFVIQFLEKCFILIENTATTTLINLDKETHSKNGEEGIIEAAISSVTLSILAQASPEIQQAALVKLYSHVTRHIFDTKTQGKAIATLCLACAKSSPKETLSKFVPHFGRLILSLTDNDEVFQESILDEELLFSLLLMSEIVRCNSPFILEYKDLMVSVLERALKLSAKEGYMLGCGILRHLLRALTNIACCDWRNIDYEDEENRRKEVDWPFDNWGHTTRIKDLKLKWDIPGEESRKFAKELLECFLKQAVQDLIEWTQNKRQMTREQVQRSLHIILSSVVGAASVLPSLSSEIINLCPYEVPVTPMYIRNTGTEPINFSDGSNIRTWVVESLKIVLNYITKTNEDDTRSLALVCEIFATIISYFGYTKTELSLAAQRIKTMKSGTQNKLLGSKRHLRYLLVERVAQQHRAMLMNKGQPEFTKLHLELFKSFFFLAQSHYVLVRILAQDKVYAMINYFPFVETLLVPMIVDELRKPSIEHNKFKGLLFLVLGRRSNSSLAIDPNWTNLNQLWPALVESPYSEKPSMVKLFDRICNLIHRGFDTFELEHNFPENIKKVAKDIWSSESLAEVESEEFKRPDEAVIDQVLAKVKSRNLQKTKEYQQLVLKIVELIEDPHLHWHRKIFAYNLFTHLTRDDHPLPLLALSLCLSSLISERLTIRLKAIQLVSAQLKLHKRKHVKKKIRFRPLNQAKESSSLTLDQLEAQAERISLNENPKPEEHQNEEEGIVMDSNSNKWMQYNLSEGNYSKEQWDNLIFIDKPHLGFYCWPKELEVYEVYEKQPELNRPIEKLNEFELLVYKKFTDPEFIEKLVNYFCFEDNKGSSETQRFDVKRPSLFKCLFCNFGPCMIEPFRKYVVEYASSSCEQKQKFVIEFLAGLIRGSKHWSFEMMNDLKVFVLSILDQMTISQENFNDWTGLANHVFHHRDVKRFEWLLNYFVTKATCQTESTLPSITPFIQTSRLWLAHCSLIQCQWRAVDHVFPRVIENLKFQDHLLDYANVRTCLASIYSLIYMFDDPTLLSNIPGTLNDGPKRSDFINYLLTKLAVLEKSKFPQSTLNSSLDITKTTTSASQHHSDIITTTLQHQNVAVANQDHVNDIVTMSSRGCDIVNVEEGEENLEVNDSKSRFISGRDTHVSADSNAAIASLSMETETSDSDGMVLLAATLMKYRQMDTNPPVIDDLPPTSSSSVSHSLQSSANETVAELGVPSVAESGPPGMNEASFVDSLRKALPVISVATSTSTTHNVASITANCTSSTRNFGQVSSTLSSSDESKERRDAIKLMKFTSCWIVYNVCCMKSPVPADFFRLLPIICEMGRESNDPELAADSLAAVAMLSTSTLSPEAVVESLLCVRKIISDHSWHARVAAAAFIEIMVSSNLFKLLNSEQLRKDIEDIVINYLICDERIEVRESSSLTLSGMLHCEFTKLDDKLLDEFKRRANEPLVKKKQAIGFNTIDSKSVVIRHSGILCLCACVDAHPYTVPEHLPEILTLLSDHLTDPQPISTTIKKTMSNFRRTHYDNWQSDKTKFTDDQLCILADLLVSPSYYA